MVCDTPYFQNKFGDPRFFYVFNLFYHFLPTVKVLKKTVRGNFWARTSLKLKSWKGDCKKVHRMFGQRDFSPKEFLSTFFTKYLLTPIAEVFQDFCGWFRVSLSFLYFVCPTLLWIHVLHIDSNISGVPVYAPFNLGQCLNVIFNNYSTSARWIWDDR